MSKKKSNGCYPVAPGEINLAKLLQYRGRVASGDRGLCEVNHRVLNGAEVTHTSLVLSQRISVDQVRSVDTIGLAVLHGSERVAALGTPRQGGIQQAAIRGTGDAARATAATQISQFGSIADCRVGVRVSNFRSVDGTNGSDRR